ncbi:malate dehydrogenase [Lysinibacillus sp. 2017]|uniref:malate dehydrogenase n=1 Tax=unclassified Lysinibacillus TaxID=2636778 RepID=UPI000D5260C9|nr:MULTISPECIES: malate dehydrogenase [unclassified Lysinibacillus]AWE07238.1 malate dehydrogenase [Lysinibacillus sp. 2017]TGN34696.1 malate dehydrogenase [Lysinibacillus sp. S2017]
MGFKKHKIVIVGAGNTGMTAALYLAQKQLGDIVLIDIPEVAKPTAGKALDLLQAGPIENFNVNVMGTDQYAEMEGASLVIVTAGFPRKPGMSRNDLVKTNANIMKNVAQNIKKYAPDSIVLVLSNPVDAMTYVCLKETGFEPHRVIGQSGVLDAARFNTFVAQELGIGVEDVSSFVLGGHGDEMVPLIRYSYVGGIPVEKVIAPNRLEKIVERTRKGGGEIVALLGNGSAYYAPAAATVKMAETIIRDQKRIIPSVAYLQGQYGYNDICLGVPTILGGNGIENIVQLDLEEAEKEALAVSANVVKEMVDFCKTL